MRFGRIFRSGFRNNGFGRVVGTEGTEADWEEMRLGFARAMLVNGQDDWLSFKDIFYGIEMIAYSIRVSFLLDWVNYHSKLASHINTFLALLLKGGFKLEFPVKLIDSFLRFPKQIQILHNASSFCIDLIDLREDIQLIFCKCIIRALQNLIFRQADDLLNKVVLNAFRNNS